ncbi:MAG: DUF5357 domain-containing protein [Cyanothece sp. SIO1E1]|nr:DUF5357 domain-containing protein [Cyanothece sp. SIO1E1]
MAPFNNRLNEFAKTIPLLGPFLGLIVFLINFLKPPRYFAWSTLIWLSLFSWVMAFLASSVETAPITRGFLSTMAWVFLTLGIGWWLTERPVRILGLSLGPWLTGGLACAFLFGSWNGNFIFPPIAFIVWPLMSAAIAALPRFISPTFTLQTPAPPARQELVILLLVNLLFSCWFQFHFMIQDWLRDYPSLLSDPSFLRDPSLRSGNFNRSAFIFYLEPEIQKPSKGPALLERAEDILIKELDDLPWTQMERWLLNLEDKAPILEARAMASTKSFSEVEEASLWDLRAKPLSMGSDYRLELLAIWQGPSSISEGYHFKKSCSITRQPDGKENSPGKAQVTCEPPSGQILGVPDFIR